MLQRSREKNVSAGLVALALFAVAIPVLPIHWQQSAPDDPIGLESVFEHGPLLQDRNGDGFIDFVDAHVVLGESPTDVDIVAAANVAARLGYETTSMDLPMTGGSAGVAIAIGQGALEALAIRSDALGVDLEPGLGVVTILNNEADGTLVVAGGDNAGTAAASLAFSGHAPHIWDPEGATFSDVVTTAREMLEAAGVTDVDARVTRIVVENDVAGLRRLDLDVGVGADAFGQAEMVLREEGEKREETEREEEGE